jgi:Cyclin-dependent kinase inhibitor
VCVLVGNMSVATLSMSMEQRRELSRLNRPRASRCLYGSPDPAELNRKYEQVSREHMQRFRDRWGYDPERDCPVTDHERYQWERVGAAEDAPKPPASPPTGEREHRDSSPDEPSVAVSSESPKQTLKQTQTTMEGEKSIRKNYYIRTSVIFLVQSVFVLV